MFAKELSGGIKPSRSIGVILIALGSVLLIFALVLFIHFTNSFQVILDNTLRFVLGINRKLGAVPEYDSRVYWYVSRSAAITAYLVLTIAVIFGLVISIKMIKNLKRLPPVYEIHKILAFLSLGFGLLHALVLLGDTYMNFSISDIAVPFYTSYSPLWVGFGIIAFYLMCILVLSFYIRGLISHRGWRLLHYSTFIVWIGITLHGIKTGSDSSTTAMQVVYWTSISATSVLVLLRLYRVIKSKKKTKRKFKWIDE